VSEEQTHRGERGSCRSCGKSILWVVTSTGKRMPLDAEPERRFVIDASANPMSARIRNTYQSHFATCPQADRWRGTGSES
jgi:hypothetical protein